METGSKDLENSHEAPPAGAGRSFGAALTRRPRVIVVGGGFAGLECVRGLVDTDVDVTLVDRHNYHLFQPLLYQVATAALEPADISGPLRMLVRGKNVNVLMGEVEGVDVDSRRLVLSDRELPYDRLVIATGAAHSYFGHDDWAPRAPGLKTVEDALEIRRRILYAYEAAERELDPERQRAWLTFVVIGAGPTGVELAGALAEISRQTRARDFRNIDPHAARIVLLEGLPRVLTAYSEELSAKARRSLERLGVEVHTSTRVTHVDGHAVRSEHLTIAARTVLWAAGVAASPIVRSLGAELDEAGRVRVTPELTVPGHDELFVAGDLAHLTLELSQPHRRPLQLGLRLLHPPSPRAAHRGAGAPHGGRANEHEAAHAPTERRAAQRARRSIERVTEEFPSRAGGRGSLSARGGERAGALTPAPSAPSRAGGAVLRQLEPGEGVIEELVDAGVTDQHGAMAVVSARHEHRALERVSHLLAELQGRQYVVFASDQ